MQPLEVINYFLNEAEGFTSTNVDLVGRFEPLLKSADFGRANHATLKKITNKLVVVKKLHGRKVFVLKPVLQGLGPHDILREIATPPDSPDEDEVFVTAAGSRRTVYQPQLPEADAFVRPKPPPILQQQKIAPIDQNFPTKDL